MFQKDLIYERKDGIPGGSSRESDGPGQTQGSARGLFPARPALSHESHTGSGWRGPKGLSLGRTD